MSEQKFLNLIKYVLDNGSKKEIFGHSDKYLLSIFGGSTLRFNLQEGFPVMTTRKTPWKLAIKEMLRYTTGVIDAAKMRKEDKLTIWDEWAVNYHNKKNNTKLSLTEWQQLVDSGDIKSEILPTHYGNLSKKRYIKIKDSYISEEFLDQSRWLLDGMRKTPSRKSFHLTMWEAETTYQMADETGNESVIIPACWHSHTLNYLDGKLNMSVLGRSWDIWTAGAWNIAQYSALLHMYAHCLNFPVGEIEFYTTDTHLYSNLLDVTKQQLERTPYQFPTLTIKDRGQKYLQDFSIDDFIVTDYKSHPTLKGDITVVGGY